MARITRPLLAPLAAAAAAVALPAPAWACTLCSCSASSTALNFGSYDPTAASPADTSATVSINCTGLVSLLGSVDVQLSPGTSGTATARTMAQGTARLAYNIYTNSTRTSVFGTGSGGTLDVIAALNGLLVFGTSVTAYGRIPAKQWVKAGAYSDSIVVTITY